MEDEETYKEEEWHVLQCAPEGYRNLRIHIGKDGHFQVSKNYDKPKDGIDAAIDIADTVVGWLCSLGASWIAELVCMELGRRAWYCNESFKREVLGKTNTKTRPSIFDRAMIYLGAVGVSTAVSGVVMRQWFRPSDLSVDVDYEVDEDEEETEE